MCTTFGRVLGLMPFLKVFVAMHLWKLLAGFVQFLHFLIDFFHYLSEFLVDIVTIVPQKLKLALVLFEASEFLIDLIIADSLLLQSRIVIRFHVLGLLRCLVLLCGILGLLFRGILSLLLYWQAFEFLVAVTCCLACRAGELQIVTFVGQVFAGINQGTVVAVAAARGTRFSSSSRSQPHCSIGSGVRPMLEKCTVLGISTESGSTDA